MIKKIILLVFVAILFGGYSYKIVSQTILQERNNHLVQDSLKERVIIIIETERHHLNSKGKSMISGVNRILLPIKLPKNTIKWYYYVCATNESSTQNIQLAAQIGVLLGTKGYANVSEIKVPEGSSYCNVYLIANNKDADLFEKGKDFSFCKNESRINFSSGIVKCSDILADNLYLAIKNDRKVHAVDVVVEVVAIVRE